MLALSPLRSSSYDEKDGELGGFSAENNIDRLDDINFDDLFLGFDDGDILPYLEVDPAEILAEFSLGVEETEHEATSIMDDKDIKVLPETETSENKNSMMEKDEVSAMTPTASSSSSENCIGRKPSSKRKTKVDWTPELHRRFVQAVEQLGVDKAVPSRILELMGIDTCLTRHNIASHLQKYRSRRKHLLSREAEAASWTQRRQMYPHGGGARPPLKFENINNQWLAPTMGFPPAQAVSTIRPLHVWGRPTVQDQSLAHVWPKHLVRSPPPPLHWGPHPPLVAPPDPSYWHPHYPRVPNALIRGAPFYPQPMPTVRFLAPPLSPGPLYRPSCAGPAMSKHSASMEVHPPKENIDAAIGDILSKPWSPLPLGLKPPSLESVIGELQKQGIQKIPPTYS